MNEARNFEFLSYGLIAAWAIVAVFVLMMVRRQRKLRQEIAGLRAMLEERGGPGDARRSP